MITITLFGQFLLFLLLSFLCFFTPGLFLLRFSKINLSNLEKVFLSGIIGYVNLTLLIYLLALLKIWWLALLIILTINILSAKKSNFKLKHLLESLKIPHLINSLSNNPLLILLFVIGILGQMAIISPSGSIINGTLYFWSALGHDGIWHIALIEQIKNGLPLQNPVFAGSKLVNYHYLSDIPLAFFSYFFGFNSFDLLFKFFPFVYSLWLGLGVFLLTSKLSNLKWAPFWAVFFVYFSGSFGFLVTLFRNHKLSGESIFWSSQVQSSSGNPPQIIALVLIIAFLLIFNQFTISKSWHFGFFTTLIIGLLTELKVYAAIVLFLSLGILSLYQILKQRQFSIFLLIIPSVLLSLALFLPNSSNSTGFLIFQPWWFIRTMIVSSDKLNWLDLELRRQTYLYEHNYKRVILIESLGFLIFLLGNLGTKVIGLAQLFRLKQIIRNILLQLLLLVALFSFLAPLLFLQKGVAGNTIQFLQYFLLTMAILSAITLANILSKLKFSFPKIILLIIIIVLSVPTQVGLIYDFYSREAFSKISQPELQALAFLKKNTPSKSTITSPPYNKYLKNMLSTPPIWAWSDTAYLSALSGRKSFIADTEQLDIMGYDYKRRVKENENIFTMTDTQSVLQTLRQNQIDYLYFPKNLKPAVNLEKTSLKKVFENQEIEIWSVN